MGNSIEEDIKILEELRTHGYAMLLMKYEDRIKTNRKIDQALEHIVSDYKRVLKENEELKNDYENLNNSVVVKNYCIKNSIPIQKVKDKIEELKEQYNVRELDFIKTTQDIRNIIIQSLEELIEGKN